MCEICLPPLALSRRTVCAQLCPNPQPYVPVSLTRFKPVIPLGRCYHASVVWRAQAQGASNIEAYNPQKT